MPHLQLHGLVKAYDGRTVVRGLDLAVEQGELLCLLGPSGCGKSTTLGMIAGFIEPSAGRIVLGGIAIQEWAPHRRDMGVVFQNYALFPHLTVAENVAFGLRLRHVAKSEIAERTARALQLSRLTGFEKRFPRQLSGGQQQRVAMARAIVIEPKMLLLDEPFSNLDTKLRAELRREVLEIQRALNITTIFVTHDQEEALAISDRVAVMNDGAIEHIGRPREVYARPRTAFVARFVGEVNALSGKLAASSDGDLAVELDGGARIGVATGAGVAGDRVTVYVRPESLHVAAATLTAGDDAHPAPSTPGGAERTGDPAGGTPIAATVAEVTFLGSRTRYLLTSALGSLTAECANDRQFSRDERVRVSWSAADAAVVPG